MIMNMIFLEDDLVIRNNYSIYLKKFFTNVFEASNAIEALEIYQKNNIYFMLVDIEMEGMNGIDFIKKIREFDSKVLIVSMSNFYVSLQFLISLCLLQDVIFFLATV